MLRALLDTEPGEVLVVDGGGGARALAGELFATGAARRKLAGVVIDGACRDTPRLATLPLPLYARWVCPAAGTAERLGETQRPVVCGGPRVTAVQMPSRVGNIEPDLAAPGPEGAVESGVSARSAQGTSACARRSR